MCGTQDPMDSGLPGGTPPLISKIWIPARNFPVTGKLGGSGLQVALGWGFLGIPNPRPGNWGWGFFIFGKIEKSPGMGIGDLESPKTLSKNSI